VTYVPPVPPCPPVHKGFFSEAVIICDKYHDFLGKTLPHNKYQFDKLVVVTSYEDKETQRICEHSAKARGSTQAWISYLARDGLRTWMRTSYSLRKLRLS
jgi:hypothetical protein